jgi:hypothetical protein
VVLSFPLRRAYCTVTTIVRHDLYRALLADFGLAERYMQRSHDCGCGNQAFKARNLTDIGNSSKDSADGWQPATINVIGFITKQIEQ